MRLVLILTRYARIARLCAFSMNTHKHKEISISNIKYPKCEQGRVFYHIHDPPSSQLRTRSLLCIVYATICNAQCEKRRYEERNTYFGRFQKKIEGSLSNEHLLCHV